MFDLCKKQSKLQCLTFASIFQARIILIFKARHRLKGDDALGYQLLPGTNTLAYHVVASLMNKKVL
jgi:hypothetical protein